MPPETIKDFARGLFVVVTTDPRSSHRPAEAIRLAAGVAAWRKVPVSLYLSGPAVVAVNPDVDDFVDEESYTRYLPMLAEFGSQIFVESESHLSGEPGQTPHRKISRSEFTHLALQAGYLLRF